MEEVENSSVAIPAQEPECILYASQSHDAGRVSARTTTGLSAHSENEVKIIAASVSRLHQSFQKTAASTTEIPQKTNGHHLWDAHLFSDLKVNTHERKTPTAFIAIPLTAPSIVKCIAKIRHVRP